MSLFRRSKTTTYDPFLGLGHVQQAHAALVKGDWGPASSILNAHRGDRSALVDMLVADEVPVEIYERWASEEHSSLAKGLLATRLVMRAWEIRGSGYAESVDKDAWPRFRRTLRQADAVAQEANAIAPNADAWSAATTVGRGLSLRIEEIQRRFEQAHAVQPFHRTATSSLLQARCAKWQGSHEDMFSFARWVSAQAGKGAPAQGAVAQAHYERWAAMRSNDEGISSSHYFSQPDVSSENFSIAQGFLDATSTDPKNAEHLLTLNWLLYVVGRVEPRPKPLINELINRIDGRPTEWPWLVTFSGKIGERYDKALKAARR